MGRMDMHTEGFHTLKITQCPYTSIYLGRIGLVLRANGVLCLQFYERYHIWKNHIN